MSLYDRVLSTRSTYRSRRRIEGRFEEKWVLHGNEWCRARLLISIIHLFSCSSCQNNGAHRHCKVTAPIVFYSVDLNLHSGEFLQFSFPILDCYASDFTKGGRLKGLVKGPVLYPFPDLFFCHPWLIGLISQTKKTLYRSPENHISSAPPTVSYKETVNWVFASC